jgi:glycosyltransferase involved in cell wall biosynthesis
MPITLVSCLMVTLGSAPRLPMVTRAIAAFRTQTHRARELVIVVGSAGEAAALEAIVPAQADAAIRIVAAPRPGLTLGALRNLAVARAHGDVVCQWDDDDLHHPERIAAQLDALAGYDACLLGEVMLLDAAARTLRWANWAETEAGGHPGTLMAKRSRMPAYPESGPSASLGEDLAVWKLLAANPVGRLRAVPHLYVYVSHGDNSWSAEHHRMLAERLALSRGLLRRREASIRTGLAPFGLDGMEVCGSNGPAFIL